MSLAVVWRRFDLPASVCVVDRILGRLVTRLIDPDRVTHSGDIANKYPHKQLGNLDYTCGFL